MMRNQSPARVWFLIICCLSQLLQAGFSSVANTSLPEIAKQMRVGMDALQWVVGGYMLAVASLVGAAGPMADRFGRRTMLVIGNLVMVAGSVVCALSPGISQLIAGRIVQGAGAAMMAPAGLSLLTSAYTGTAERAFAVMWWSVVGTVSLSSGPIIGGLIVHYLGWRYVFWLGIPLGLAAAIGAFAILPESRPAKPASLDPVGQMLLTLVLAAASFALIEGVRLGWTSVPILLAGAVGLGCAVLLVPIEARKKHPALPVRLFTNRGFSGPLLTAAVSSLALAGLLFLNTFYLQGERGLDASVAGFVTLPLVVGATISVFISRRAVAKGYARMTMLISGVLMVLGTLALWATEHAALSWIIVPYLIFGLGYGLIAEPISVMTLDALPASQSGLASSMISETRRIGQLLGTAIIGTMLGFAGGVSESIAFDDLGGWVWGFLTAMGVLIILFNVRRPPVTQPVARTGGPSPASGSHATATG